ncbi:TonB-dependent receptor [Aestuariicella hydrocarbonica]|uniref:TonB-dependent receptor n=1 Tax=Pseudomaricurvus hydrocarbonicus TaxID=1470433 RepID=A0A9E5T3I8_9GAMM|nr:TonB-dependent receptor [Aestuariicella hydrocarbonica]NHO67187.1 TonB-dependent receptor [Aestuariicella hydrocarbonica]
MHNYNNYKWKINPESSHIYAMLKRTAGAMRRKVFFLLLVVIPIIFSIESGAEEDIPRSSSQTVLFNIPQQSADRALILYAEQANLTVLFPFDKVSTVTANQVKGNFTLQDAVNIMLVGTGLEAWFENKNTIKIGLIEDRRMQYKNNLLALLVGTTVGASGAGASDQAELPMMEEVRVTGSHIKGASTNMANPVSSINRDDMEYSGSPTLVELLRNMPGISGSDGEANLFGSAGLEGTANINLRGMGPGRTLVLINGRRQTFSPHSIVTDKMLFVDINNIPEMAISKVDFLKEGAAATYGSDAMAGVVNFLTRSDFEGLEITGSYKDINGSDGDTDLGMIWGVGNEITHWVTSLSYNQRRPLKVADDSDKLLSYADNPQGGWSSFGNPVTIYDAAGGSGTADPNCELLGGVDSTFCRFQYTGFFNLINDETHLKGFSELNHSVNDSLNLHAEVLYAKTETRGKGAPSLPPAVAVDNLNRFVPDYHPGWQDMVAQFPDLAALDDQQNPEGLNGVAYRGRIIGSAGPAATHIRDHETFRVAFNVDGSFDNGINYDGGVTYSRAEMEGRREDAFVDRLRLALLGLGGPDCSGSTPGANGCQFYNPFSNAIRVSGNNGVVNPSYNPAVANSAGLMSWVSQPTGADESTDLFTADIVFSGELYNFELAGGALGYAVGAQYRRESYELDPIDNSDLSINPCPTPGDTTCTIKSGPFGYEAATLPFEDDQDIVSVFGELALPLTENLDVQLALRFEDYGGEVGYTIDPKVAVRWQLSDSLALRGSASTTFRGPTLNQLGGVSTANVYVSEAGAYKPVDTRGNPDLEPETAVGWNVGLIASLMDDAMTLTIDYWSFDIQDSIVVEPTNSVIAAAKQGIAPYVDQVALGAAGNFSTVERINTSVINGPDLDISGIDFGVRYDVTAAWYLSMDANYNVEYEVSDAGIINGFSALGSLNQGSIVRPLPRWKGRFVAGYNGMKNSVNLVANYVHHYSDNRSIFSSNTNGQVIDSQTTFDLNYNYLLSEDTRLSLSVQNLTDEDAPFARLDLNYDPYTHSPLGRTLKLSFSHHFN